MASAKISSLRSKSGAQPLMRRMAEKAGGTFTEGVPVQWDTTNTGIQEWDGTTITSGIAGTSKEIASNLATTGVARNLTFGSVPNQPLAQNIPAGAPINDGRIGFELADRDTVFFAQIGPAQTLALTDLTKQYGMTKDTDGHWFVDKTKATVGTNVVCQIVKLDDRDILRGVHIVFLATAQQVLG